NKVSLQSLFPFRELSSVLLRLILGSTIPRVEARSRTHRRVPPWPDACVWGSGCALSEPALQHAGDGTGVGGRRSRCRTRGIRQRFSEIAYLPGALGLLLMVVSDRAQFGGQSEAEAPSGSRFDRCSPRTGGGGADRPASRGATGTLPGNSREADRRAGCAGRAGR